MKNEMRCYFCHGGPVVEKNITHVSEVQGGFVEIKGVPCEVCEECGEKYFAPEIVRHIQEIIKGKTEEFVRLPVYSYA